MYNLIIIKFNYFDKYKSIAEMYRKLTTYMPISILRLSTRLNHISATY